MWRTLYACVSLGSISLTTAVAPAFANVAADAPEQLKKLSLEELLDVEVTSVSRRPEKLLQAASAIQVITAEDIRRSGATSLPEALRLATNLQVARIDSSQYAIAARGFNGGSSNKLLVLIDGRVVYTTLTSTVLWEAQDVLLADIDRIEVISGPGGTLWGSNAVNGVINIITRDASATQGAYATAIGGTAESGAALRYGGTLSETTSYRVYAKRFERDSTVKSNGDDALDSWYRTQAGFRFDWRQQSDALTVQGDVYEGSIDQAVNGDKVISGGNLLARWSKTLRNGSQLQIQTYYDRARRDIPGTLGQTVDTYDIDVQQLFRWRDSHTVVWGGGYRESRDTIANTALLAFVPPRFALKLSNLFLSDSMRLSNRLKLTLGVKLEHNSYTAFEVQPDARLTWRLSEDALLWSSVSRAVRTPSRVDRDFVAPGTPPYTLLVANPTFESETLIAYELGYRAQPLVNTYLSIAAFYNDYDRLRTVDRVGAGAFPIIITNNMEGSTYGVEVTATQQIYDWWRVSIGYSQLTEQLRFKAGSTDVTTQRGGSDPAHQFSLRSNLYLPHNIDIDIALRSVTALPSPNVPGYIAVDARFSYLLGKDLELSIAGFNLLDERHPEFGVSTTRSEIERSVYGKVTWRY